MGPLSLPPLKAESDGSRVCFWVAALGFLGSRNEAHSLCAFWVLRPPVRQVAVRRGASAARRDIIASVPGARGRPALILTSVWI
jgi:hypothetical protein